MDFRVTKGEAAANVYSYNSQLTIDWSGDGLYFKYENDDWVIVSLSKKTNISNIFKLDYKKQAMFKRLCFYALNELKYFAQIPNETVLRLQEIVDLFV